MGGRRHSWQLIVFTAAILVPSAALVIVSQRTMEQNRELAGKRRQDEQRASRQRIAREMLARVETLKNAAAKAEAASGSEVALVARVESGRLVPPWEDGSAAANFRELTARPPGFAAAIARGQQAEFAGPNLEAAAAGYKEALDIASNPLQSANARLLLAGVLRKQHRTAESAAEARQVLEAPPSLADEDGVPLAIQAAALLVRSPADRPAIRAALTLATQGHPWHSPMTVAALSNLAAELEQTADAAGRGWIREFRDRLAASIRLQEQLQALQDDLPKLGLLQSAGHPVWIYYPGAEPWLVGAQFDGVRPALVVGVRAREVFRPFEAAGNLRFLASTDPGGELLADSFPGLKVRFAGADASDSGGGAAASGLYYSVLFVLVGGTAFGTSLLWRSLRREMELAETRSQFVASVSHELKTPLTAIRMFAETLQMGRSLDSKARDEYLETISNECERLSRLVDNVLLFSRIEQGKHVYRFRKTGLAHVVRRAAHTVAYQLSQHGFELGTEVDENLPAIHADPDAVEQAVLNLLTNAMKYSGEKRRIELRLGQRDSEAFIRVTDHGVGIAAAELQKIFEKYYRAPGSQSIPGTGLGLTLVAQIAKAHGGRVNVESTPGEGSTFTIWLPLGREA